MATSIRYSRELSGVPGLLRFAQSPTEAFTEAFQRYGAAVEFKQVRYRYLLLSDPAAIEAVLLEKLGDFRKDRFTRDLGDVLGDGLLTNEGEAWRAQRKRVAAAFQPRKIAALAETMVRVVDDALAPLKDGERRDLHAEMMRLALDIVVKTLFGTEFSRFEEVESCLAHVAREYELLWHTWRAVLPRWVPLPARRRLAGTRERLDQILLEIIRKKRAHPGSDLLSELMQATDESGRTMTDAELRDEAMTLFLAGHETTALVLTYTFYLLATHPVAYERLLAEIDAVLAGQAPTNESVQQLPFCNAVLRESMRLYPPVWAMAREATRDVTVAGLAIKANTQVILSQWVVQRDPRHFSEPMAFKPERWLSGECRDLPRFSYFPFGGGPRVCVGQHFALLEAALLLARTSQRFRVERVDRAPLELSPVITLRPLGPMPFVFHLRAGGERVAAAE